MDDIIIIGAGPAGLTAAIYALRAGKSALLIEAKTYGGQIVNAARIDNYPGLPGISGFEFAQKLYEQATALGARIVYETAVAIEDKGETKTVKTSAPNEYEGKAVIIATGARNKPMGLAREDKLLGRGVSYCATCDGMFFRGKDVAVFGGGRIAVEDALFLSEYCAKVYVIHSARNFGAAPADVERLKARENVELLLGSTVTKLIGEEKLSAVEVTSKSDGSVREISAAGLFVAIGQMPDNGAFANTVDLDEKGYVAADEGCRTKTPGVYAAGDCRAKEVRQLTTAAADGTVAALAACGA